MGDPDEAPAEAPSRKLLLAIVEAAATRFDIPVSLVISENRTPVPTRARRAVMMILRAQLKMSYPAIGAFVNRDHTSVIAAIRQGNADPKIGTERIAEIWAAAAARDRPVCPTCGQEVDRDKLIRDLRMEVARLAKRLEILARK